MTKMVFVVSLVSDVCGIDVPGGPAAGHGVSVCGRFPWCHWYLWCLQRGLQSASVRGAAPTGEPAGVPGIHSVSISVDGGVSSWYLRFSAGQQCYWCL